MVTLTDLENKSLALVIWNQGKEDDVHVYLGQLNKTDVGLIFKNEEKGWTVPIDESKLEKIRIVTDDIKLMLLNADFYLNLTIGDMVNNEGNYIPTGMKWHE